MIRRDYSNFDWENVNPHMVRDGKWGGFGPSYWHRAERYGFEKGNVAEWHYVNGDPKWWRVWCNELNKWRPLTAEEAAKLPSFKPVVRPDFDRALQFPVNMKKSTVGEDERDDQKDAVRMMVAAVLCEPLLQVIDPAPVIKAQFEN